MTRKLFIVFLLMAVALPAATDDFIDDVYYWPSADSNQPSEVSSQQSVVSHQPSTVSRQEEPKTQITFINDSLTQRSDTVVKAVIHRN